MMPLSVIVITLNEAHNITRCLAAAAPVAAELLVVDSNSTDGTQELARNLGARVLSLPWQGYRDTRNAAATAATHPWILFLDADEVLTPELQLSILAAQAAGFPAGVYSISRLTNYCGQWVHHSGWRPDVKPRLYHRDKASWQGGAVHEYLQPADPAAKPQRLAGDCLHYSFPSLDWHIQKIRKYARLEAEQLHSRGRRAGVYHLAIKPAAEFFTVLILKRGLLDGKTGLILAWMAAWAKFAKYANLYTLQNSSAGFDKKE